jgi:hypothetical protein
MEKQMCDDWEIRLPIGAHKTRIHTYRDTLNNRLLTGAQWKRSHICRTSQLVATRQLLVLSSRREADYFLHVVLWLLFGMPGFNPKVVHVGYVVDEVALGRFFSEGLPFIQRQCCILICREGLVQQAIWGPQYQRTRSSNAPYSSVTRSWYSGHSTKELELFPLLHLTV